MHFRGGEVRQEEIRRGGRKIVPPKPWVELVSTESGRKIRLIFPLEGRNVEEGKVWLRQLMEKVRDIVL